jgi:hypothetical protein
MPRLRLQMQSILTDRTVNLGRSQVLQGGAFEIIHQRVKCAVSLNGSDPMQKKWKIRFHQTVHRYHGL